MNSLWSQTVRKPHFQPLCGDETTDVLIIGGGLTGLLCAYMLQQAKVPYLLVEANEIGDGITKNTTAKITAQHGLIYHKLIQKYGTAAASLYYKANTDAIRRYKQLCDELECDFQTQDAFVYTTDHMEKIVDEMDAYHRMGVSATFTTKLPLPIPILGAIKLSHQGQLHPLEFLYRLSRNLTIREHTKVIALAPHHAQTNRGTIRFQRAIVATHFPILNKHGCYFLKMYQHRSYVLALEKGPNVGGMYVDESNRGLSFRNHDRYLLLGGGGHRTGKKGGGWQELERFAKTHYPTAPIAYRWATQDCMTLDGLPYVGRYAKHTHHLFTATGYNKWGFTTAMVAAKLLCDQMLQKPSPLATLLSPSRSIWHPQLVANGWETMCNLLTPTPPRCPHLGCALKYNKAEHSWDCPCHGSRFASDGQLLDNPATDDLSLPFPAPPHK